MYSEQLEALIKNILADGVITEKERAVLHKKAEAEGVDTDEIDVYIDGELDKIRNEQMKAKAQVQKCPACGEIIPLSSKICPLCGTAVDNKEAGNFQKLVQSIEDNIIQVKKIISLFQSDISILDIFSSNREDEFVKSKASAEKDIRAARIYYGDDKKIRLLIDELEGELSIVEQAYNKYTKKKKMTKRISLVVFLLPTIFSIIDLIKDPSEGDVWEDLLVACFFAPVTLAIGAVLALLCYKVIINSIK